MHANDQTQHLPSNLLLPRASEYGPDPEPVRQRSVPASAVVAALPLTTAALERQPTASTRVAA
jgi:hypothetical protein